MPEGRIQLFSFFFSVSFSQILNQISYGLTKLHFVWLKKEISPWVWSEDIQQHKTCCLFVMAGPKDPGKTLKEIWHNLNIIQAIERNVMRFIPYYLKNSSFDVSFSIFSCKDMGTRQHLSSTQTILRWRWLSCLQVCLRCMLPSHLQLLLQHFCMLLKCVPSQTKHGCKDILPAWHFSAFRILWHIERAFEPVSLMFFKVGLTYW